MMTGSTRKSKKQEKAEAEKKPMRDKKRKHSLREKATRSPILLAAMAVVIVVVGTIIEIVGF